MQHPTLKNMMKYHMNSFHHYIGYIKWIRLQVLSKISLQDKLIRFVNIIFKSAPFEKKLLVKVKVFFELPFFARTKLFVTCKEIFNIGVVTQTNITTLIIF